MTVAACLAWYDERLEHLAACVLSLAGHVDRLIAADGAWHDFPGGQPVSPGVQRDVLVKSARATDIDLVELPPATYPTQTIKRAALMETAAADPHIQWALVIDADETLHVLQPGWRDQLANTDRDVAKINVRNRGGELAGTVRPHRRIFRAEPGLTVEQAHNGYRLHGRWLAGDTARVRPERALNLTRHMVIDHRATPRNTERQHASDLERRARHRARREVFA